MMPNDNHDYDDDGDEDDDDGYDDGDGRHGDSKGQHGNGKRQQGDRRQRRGEYKATTRQKDAKAIGYGAAGGRDNEAILAGNVADMSRHVRDDTTCRSNFGQMGPCRRHKI